MLKDDYLNATSNNVEEEISDPLETVAETWKRVEVEGKAYKNVPVLFSPDMQESVEIMLELKDKLNEGLDSYPYLFGSTKQITRAL